jgi:hypothetical protein
VPLSEEEQRILHEIERNFYEHDPDFAARVRKETVYRHAGRNCKWSALAFLGGLAILVVWFSTSLLLGLLGFFIMLFSAIYFERNLRHIGRAGLQQMTKSMRARGLSEALGDTQRRLRERFKRSD